MEAESNFSQIAPPIFNEENYDLWAVKMEAYLEALDLWEAIEEDYEVLPLPDNPTVAQIRSHKERKIRKAKAKSCLFAGVSQTIFTRVMALKTAKSIWDYLKEEYAGDERIRSMQVLNLMREFELQRMKESETIKEYSDKLLGIANKVRLLGSDFADSRIVEKILVTVPERYEASKASLENTKNLSKITLAEVQNHVVEGALPAKHHEVEQSKKKHFKKNQASSNQSPTSNQMKGKGGHPPFKCWRRPEAKCSKCNQMGHEAIICKNKNCHDEGAQIADQEEEDRLFVATCFLSSESNESWLIDSGCTNHMTFDEALFKDLRPTNITKVRIGNGDYITVKGKGTVAITSCVGTKFIPDVLLVPQLDQNLLSVGQLIERGFKAIFEDKYCLIQDAAGQDMFKVKMKGKSFALNPLEEEQAAFSLKENITEIWHKRLGHYHHQGLLQLSEKGLARDVPELQDRISNGKACQFGKQNRKSFSRTTWRASKKLQLIHTDVAGPQRTPSLKGNLYYILFIDDFTRMCWIFFFKNKSEVAEIFWKFKAKVENETGSKIQILRSDNGTEYTSEKFNQFCVNSGIEHQLTTPYTPQ
uniref:Retrovirus-related Pol polyprotein from transposon TNT 1-94 n=1 Tax=Cajanus cajan TaxID=3821 RepID=A0A151UAW8_CAJCA|nr:Retrovirus-related Pol polyprotein from transposon TNT 1-94 [Cajanus cajan]